MRPIQVKTPQGALLADFAWQATSFSERLRGWMGKPSVKNGEGLLLSPSSSIHSFGMRFDFDLAFLDRQGRVLKLYGPLRPGRTAWAPLGPVLLGQGVQALELPAGSFTAHGVQVGQVLTIEER
jgi:uncharacterized membrane protein (UPF0127 family)